MIETLEKPETAQRPARAWRNKMRAKQGIIFRNYTFQAGDLFQAGLDYPSKEIAEQAALDFLSEAVDEPQGQIIANVAEYLGAFPVDEHGQA